MLSNSFLSKLDLASKDLRCNVGGASGSNTTTLPVKAGDAFTFTSDVAVYHQGPISLYVDMALHPNMTPLPHRLWRHMWHCVFSRKPSSHTPFSL